MSPHTAETIKPAGIAATPTAPGKPEASQRVRVIRRLRRNPLAVVSFAVLALALVVAALAPWLAPYAPEQTDFANTFAAPGTAGHLLGTDDLGRDVLSRIILGTRASLEVGVLAVATAMLIGVPLGLAAGYFRAADALISRFTDLLLAFPFLILAVGLAAIRGASLGNAAVAIGIAQIPGVIRIVRSDTLRLKSLDFIAAAVVDGASDLWVLGRHILPNATSVVIVQATVAIPAAILGEAVLSFLGLGIQPPDPSLGTMLANAQQFAARAPWAAVLPGVTIMVLALAFNVFGDSLRDALDPKASRQ
jgi:peptide/nickel transport system permease protein